MFELENGCSSKDSSLPQFIPLFQSIVKDATESKYQDKTQYRIKEIIENSTDGEVKLNGDEDIHGVINNLKTYELPKS